MTTTARRPFRFGFTGGASSKRQRLLDSARAVEAMGYSTFGLADHLVRPFAPLIAGPAVVDATTTLRITQTVLAQDFREPAILAKELATLGVLSEGRLQIGLGAGWRRQEYEDAGMRFDPAPRASRGSVDEVCEKLVETRATLCTDRRPPRHHRIRRRTTRGDLMRFVVA